MSLLPIWRTARLLAVGLAALLSGSAWLEGRVVTGPLVGYAEWSEAAVWLQTDLDAQVSIEYRPESGGPTQSSTTQLTTPEDHFAATFVLSDLEPGKTYTYQVWENGQPGPEGRFQTPPARGRFIAPQNFRIAVGGGLDAAGDPAIWNALAERDPAAMLWLGDTQSLTPADWMTADGYMRALVRQRQAAGMGGIISQRANYAVLGPTDYGPPGATGHWSHRQTAIEQFTAAWPAATLAFPGRAMTHQFRWGDVDFFVLDAFSFRESSLVTERGRRILGEAQITWLLDALATSDATFKVIVSGMPLLHPTEAPDTLVTYKNEERDLLSGLAKLQPTGVFLLSGGRPMGELSRVIRPDGYPLYEVISGTLTREPWTREAYEDVNYFRVPGTLTLEPHFVTLDFGGAANDRMVRIAAVNAQGAELWAQTIRESQLRPVDVDLR